jgi:crossover junction endodeoxyribonuclease RuvC
VITIGVDPGLNGAIAVLSETGDLEALHDLPIMRDGNLSWVDGGRLQSMLIDAQRGRPARVFIERVHAMPKQGVSSSFNFGVGFGSILSILQARHLSVELITPASWKREMGLAGKKIAAADGGDGRKAAGRAALDKARLLFPTAELHLCKHEGRAEALLLAHWGYRRTVGIKEAA